MNWKRPTLALVLPLWLVACGGEGDGLVDPGDDDGGEVGSGNYDSDPAPSSPDDPSDVPVTDEEAQYGEEGDEPVSAEDVAAGKKSTEGFSAPQFTTASAAAGLAAHPNVNPQNVIPANLKGNALAYFDANQTRFTNKGYITIIDMAQHSGKERLFVINMSSGAVETKTVVAHGSGGDPSNSGIPTLFSNTNNSRMSSLGFYKTGELYQSSKVGHAMKLDGLESTNSNVRARGVVMHAASYVSKGRAKQGRSWGCPAVPTNELEGLIGKLKNGSLLLVQQGNNTPIPVDGCDGKADGYYCSAIAPASAYNCRNGGRTGVTQCADSTKKCKAGTGGAATLGGGALTCE